MKKFFIIGTGRNGSKLTAKVLEYGVGNNNIFGEIHNGLDPVFFKKVYNNTIYREKAVEMFKESRNMAMHDLDGVYVEKNHLIVPILDCVLSAYPDAQFLYVKRNSRDVVRSCYYRDFYKSKDKSIYALGRLSPNNFDAWGKLSRFGKVCWYVYEMTKMCENFLKKIKVDSYRVIQYEDFHCNTIIFKDIFEWIGIPFNLHHIKKLLSKQYGSSARAKHEVGFEILYPEKFKNSQHWKDWSKDKKEIFRNFFNYDVDNTTSR